MSTDELREHLQEALGGLYSLERELPGGGMSRVFVALDEALGRRIVVKVLPPEMAAAVNVERFRREIQLAASLVHPHIVPLLSAGETYGLPYFTMPFVDGESVRARLAREWQLPVADAVRLAGQVARALDYAHRCGIVHRDMKPENILLHDGHALVTDFGIARAIRAAATSTSLTGVGIAIGTPAYMSPEQGTGEREVDGRSDVYSLGCVLFEFLAGSPPFTGSSAHAILMRHLTDGVPSVRATRAEVPLSLDHVLTKALAKEPRDRFATAAEFVAALEEPHHAVPSSSPAATRPAVTSAVTGVKRFVAVLPFENMSADAENEYFSDGITEDIIAQLSGIRGLRVVSRTSTMRYKQRPESVRAIGRELGVSHVIVGSVRRAGTRLRIVAQLIDATSDEQLWAERYDREMTDVFAIQSEVAEQIAETLHTQLSPTERSRLAKKPTDDMEAYNYYLLGRHHYAKVSAADFGKALDYYRRAIARDPGFARAYASLADAQMYLGLGYWGVRPHDVSAEVFAFATKALELDPGTAEAYATLGLYLGWVELDWEKGGAALERSIELNPSAPMVRLIYAMHLCALGRFGEALVHRQIATQLDPSAMVIRGNSSWVFYLAGEYEHAIAEGRSLREIDPSSAYGAFSLGLVCAQGGEPREAIAAFRDAVQLSGGVSLYTVMLAYALAVGGGHEEARAILDGVRQLERTEFVWPMGLAMAYAHLGEEETALDYLERAYAERVGWMPLLCREPALAVLRHAPRFQELLRRIGPPGVVH